MVCDNKTQIQRYYRLAKTYFSQLRLSRLKNSPFKKRKFMAVGYVAAILSAFVLSLVNHHDVNASITKSDSINYMMLEHALYNGGVNTVFPEASIENVKSLFDMVNKKFSQTVEKEFTVQRGDTIISLFTRIGFSKEEANDFYALIKPYFNPSSFKAGQKARVTMLIDSEDSHFISMESFVLPESSTARLIIEKDDIVTLFGPYVNIRHLFNNEDK